MEIRVLGPMEVWEGGSAVDLGPRMHRAVLALLVMHANRVVSADQLIDRLWGSEPPASAATTLRGYVAGLRRALEPARPARTPPQVLLTQPPGYLLRVAPDALDAARFESLVAEGRRQLAAGHPRAAREVLGRALALWRGPPYADLAYEPFVGPEVVRLEELAAVAAEARAEADLAVGDHVGAVAELEGLVAAEPLRERRWELYALALYRCGRQADALRALDRARRTLAEELGIDPRPSLRQLEQDILDHQASLDWVATEAAADSVPVPAEPPAPDPGPALVGRTRELAALEAALARAFRGRAGVALLAGEPGIGKTRLAAEVAARAEARGAAVAWGRCFEGEGAPAFWPWTQVVRELVGSYEADALRSLVGPAAAELAHIAPELQEVLGDAEGGSFDPERARFRLFEVVCRLLAALAARRPVVVVLDDLHWADPASLQLLAFSVTHLAAAPVLMLTTYRDSEGGPHHALGATLAALARHESTVRLALGGLAAPDIGRLVTDATGVEPSAELVGALWDRTAGNPFFAAQLVGLLQSPGPEQATAMLGDVPGGVRDVIRHRLASLPPAAAELLGLAAVVGRDFEAGVLARLAERDEEDVLGDIEAALAARLVLESPDAPGHYRFVHVLVREALYEELSGLRRARLHRRAGEALEDLGGGNPVELAHHFWQAVPSGATDKAMRYAAVAAEQAMDRLAYEESEHQLRRALELVGRLPAGPERSRWDLDLQTRLCLLLAPLRGYDDPEAAEAARRARQLCQALVDPREVARPLWRLWQFHLAGGHLPLAEDCARDILDIAEAHDDGLLSMMGHQGLGLVALERGQLEGAGDHFRRVMELEGGFDDSLIIDVMSVHGPSINRGCLAVVLGLAGEEEEARALGLDCVTVADRTGHPFTAAYARFWAAWLAAELRDVPLARRLAEEAAAGANQVRSRMWSAAAGILAGWAQALDGEGESGSAAAESALALWDDTGARMFRSLYLSLVTEAHWRAGRLEDALRVLDQARAFGDSADDFRDAELHRLRGEVMAALFPDRLADAERSMRQAIAIAHAKGARALEERAWASLSRLPAAKDSKTTSRA